MFAPKVSAGKFQIKPQKICEVHPCLSGTSVTISIHYQSYVAGIGQFVSPFARPAALAKARFVNVAASRWR